MYTFSKDMMKDYKAGFPDNQINMMKKMAGIMETQAEMAAQAVKKYSSAAWKFISEK